MDQNKLDVTICLERIDILKTAVSKLEDLLAKKYVETSKEELPPLLEECEQAIGKVQNSAIVVKEDFHELFRRNISSNNSLDLFKSNSVLANESSEVSCKIFSDNEARASTSYDLFKEDASKEKSDKVNINENYSKRTSNDVKRNKKRRIAPLDSRENTLHVNHERTELAAKEAEVGSPIKLENDTSQHESDIEVIHMKQCVTPSSSNATSKSLDSSSSAQHKEETIKFVTSVITLSSEDEDGKKFGKTRTAKVKDDQAGKKQQSNDSEDEKENRRKIKTKSVRKRRSNYSDSPDEDSDDSSKERKSKRSCSEEKPSSRKRSKERPTRNATKKRVIVISDEPSDEESSSEENSTVSSTSKDLIRIKIDNLTKKVGLKTEDSDDEHDSGKSERKSSAEDTHARDSTHQSPPGIKCKDDVKLNAEAYVSLIRYPCENLI